MELHNGPTAAAAISCFEWKPVAQMDISISVCFGTAYAFAPGKTQCQIFLYQHYLKR